MVKLPHATKEGYTMVMYRLSDPDPTKYDHDSIVKVIAMYADMLLSEHRFKEGYILIFDMKNYTLSHITKLKISLTRMVLQYYQVNRKLIKIDQYYAALNEFFSGSPSISLEKGLHHKHHGLLIDSNGIDQTFFDGVFEVSDALLSRSTRHTKGNFTRSEFFDCLTVLVFNIKQFFGIDFL